MSSGSRRLIQIEKVVAKRSRLLSLIESRPFDRRRVKHFVNEKGCGAAAALTTNRLIQRYSLPCAPVPCSVSMASSRFCWSGVRSGRICVSSCLSTTSASARAF